LLVVAAGLADVPLLGLVVPVVLVVGVLLLLLQAVSAARPMRPAAAAAVAKRLRFIVCYPIPIDDRAGGKPAQAALPEPGTRGSHWSAPMPD
jgi:hypothetical protein